MPRGIKLVKSISSCVFALQQSGDILKKTCRFKDSIKFYDQITASFKDSETPELFDSLGLALISKADAYESLGQTKDASYCYDKIIDIYGNTNDDRVRSLVQIAKENQSIK